MTAMPRKLIIRARVTKAAVDRLEPGQILRDTDLRGFGVRRQHDTSSYFLQKKVLGRVRWFTIGPHGSPWTPDRARKEAERILYGLTAGVDPQEQRRLEREKPLLRDTAKLFMESHGPKLKPRTREEYDRLLKLHILPKFGARRVCDITKGQLALFHGKMSDTPSGANFALAVLSKLMRWCAESGHLPDGSNPCQGIKKYRMGKRERFLSWDEVGRLGKVLRAAETDLEASPFVVAAIKLLILTGARLSEILTLQWSFVDFQRGLLLLPDSKTGKKTIRLNTAALDVLRRLPRVAANP